MSASHASPSKPSPIVALLCLAVVHRLRPDWVRVPLSVAARESAVGAQRLSRLCSRILAPLELLVATLTRRGRPPTPTDSAGRAAGSTADNAIVAALGEVATSLLAQLHVRGETVRALCVGAYLRLRTGHPTLSQKRFCASLALSERTLRSWLRSQRAPSPPCIAPPPPLPPTATPPLRRPRFGFDVTIPDTQVAADTTQLEAFGVKLALVAAQDVGGRDQDLLDAVIVDDHESAEHVVSVLEQAIGDKTGQQVLTDQGTPYLAERTRAALDALDADHAIQREGDPQGKATIERAFGSVKRLLAPLLSSTNALAERVHALKRVDLARALTTLLVTMLLRAYQAGGRASRRASEARTGLDEQTLVRVAEASRQKARAEHRSVRLLLTRLHSTYQLDGPLTRFIRNFRHVPLSVLHRAEAAFAAQAHRDISKRTAYFAAIAYRLHREHKAAETRRAVLSEQRGLRQQHALREAVFAQAPERQLDAALELLAAQLAPDRRSLLADGAGLGRAWLRRAIERLRSRYSGASIDIAQSIFHAFRNRRTDLDADAIAPIERLLARHLTPASTDHCAKSRACAILSRAGPISRPGPLPALRN